MNKQKKLLSISFGAFLIFLIWFLFFYNPDSKKKKTIKGEDLGFLLGGAPVTTGGQNDGSDGRVWVDRSKSIFDSDFFKSGKIIYEEDPDHHPLPQGDIPINPQTGKPYPEDAMEQFDRLREKFPKNDLIPRRMTPEETAFKKTMEERVNKITKKIMDNSVTKDEVKDYYTFQTKAMADRMQIIDYLIQSQKDSGESDEGDQFKKVQDSIKQQADQLKNERKDAYKKAGLAPPED